MPLRYDSQEPIEKTLKSFAIDLSANPSFGQILNQMRGEKVEVTLQTSNPALNGLPGTLDRHDRRHGDRAPAAQPDGPERRPRWNCSTSSAPRGCGAFPCPRSSASAS